MRRLILGVLVLALFVGLGIPANALATGPATSPMVIIQEGFEGPGTSYSLIPFVDATHSGPLYGSWFPITSRHHTGLRALWCEGTNEAAAAGPTYRLDGGGTASFDLSTGASSTADFYKTDLSFYYLLPSRGSQDVNSFNVASMWADTPTGSDPLDTWAVVPTWTRASIALSDPDRERPLSRHAGLLRFSWIPSWNVPQGVGEGPSIDDVSVTGWRYGPVRNLDAVASVGGVNLTWTRPLASTALDAAAEDRQIAYRVFRSPAAANSWTELTVTRLGDSEDSYNDTSTAIGTAYDFVVQGWEPGVGAGWGVPVSITVATPGGPAVVVSSPASGTVITSTASEARLSGTAQAEPGTTVSSVRVSISRDESQYWNGSGWQSETTSVVGVLEGSGVWSYQWQLPIDENQVHRYKVTAYARDALGAVGFGASSYRINTVVPVIPPAAPVVRAGGANRYDVATGLTADYKPGLVGYTDVIVACGEDRAMADPLGASGLAGVWDAPILLTPSKKLNASTAGMITAIRNANGGRVNIHVIGGTTSMPKAIYNALSKLKGGGTIERIDGRDRYDVAAKMAARVASSGKTVPGVMIANIENPAAFYDALAASPISARAHLPIVGVRKNGVPPQATAVLNGALAGKPRYAVNSAYLTAGVIGATGANANPPMATSGDRITAATQIASFGRTRSWVPYWTVGLANKLPDALTGGALVGMKGGVMLYTNVSPLAPTTASFLPGIKSQVKEGIVLGGPVSVSDGTVAQFYSAIQP